MTIHAYNVWLRGEETPFVINARSRGHAKARALRRIGDCLPDLRYTDLRVTLYNKTTITTHDFKRTAAYRGFPDLRCGQRVRVGQNIGTVIDHTSSATFLVLFDDDAPRYAGMSLSVHPDEMELIDHE